MRTVGLPHLIRLHLHSVPETVAAWLTNIPEPRRGCPGAAAPPAASNHRQDLPVLVGAGLGSHSRHSESTGRLWRSTNTAAYSRRPERTGALSFKTFPYSATFAPRVEDTAALCWSDQRTNIYQSVTCYALLTNITTHVQSLRKEERHDTVTMMLLYSVSPQQRASGFNPVQ